jgi:hypothetical protein
MIDFSHNDLSEQALAVLANALSINKTIKVVCLRRYVSDVGSATAIANMLRRNSIIKTIDLDGVYREPGDIQQITKMLTKNTALETIILSCFKPKGMKSWVEHLPNMRGLKNIRFCFPKNVPRETLESFVEALEGNKSFETVDFGRRAEKIVDFRRRFGRRAEKIDDLATLMPRIKHVLSLNCGGRRILTASKVPTALWPRVLARSSVDPNVLYFFLRARFTLIKQPVVVSRKLIKQPVVVSRKRKRGEWLQSFRFW